MIAVRDVSKRFGSTLAVDGLSFDVLPGRVTGFLGPNGSGKSTTMRMILGLDRPTAGSVTVHGRPYRDAPAPLREVGALLDARAVQGGRSARAHLRWLAAAGSVPRARVDEVLELVGLADVAERRIGGFSLGMSQRLGIAAALLGDPRTLLFDEPINGLDPEGIHWIRGLLRDLAAGGRTVLVSSHVLTEMEETADHVVVIGRGRLVADTGMAELTARAGGHVVVRSPDATPLADALRAAAAGVEVGRRDGELIVTRASAAQVGDLAAAHGLRLHELSPERVTLEQAFMELTRDSVEYAATGGTRASDR